MLVCSSSYLVVFLISIWTYQATALKCVDNDILKRFDLAPFEAQRSFATPPSSTLERFWVNLCEERSRKVPDDMHQCNEDDLLCYQMEVSTEQSKDSMVARLIEFPRSSTVDVYEPNDGSGSLFVALKDARWGARTVNMNVLYKCDENSKEDSVVSSEWQYNTIEISISGPSGCLKQEDGNNGNNGHQNDPKDNPERTKPHSNSSSWFVWICTYTLLFALIYLVVVSFLNSRGGSFGDFRAEFAERFIQLATGLPAFIKELITRTFNRSDSSRGGYSAV